MKEHGNFSTKAEYEAIADFPENPSSVVSGEPEFYDKSSREVSYMDVIDGNGKPTGEKIRVVTEQNVGNRIDNRIANAEQAEAEAYAAKPYMDVAIDLHDVYKASNEGVIEDDWMEQIDGVEPLIAMARDASDKAGKDWSEMSETEHISRGKNHLNPGLDEENKDFYGYMKSSAEAWKLQNKMSEINSGQGIINEDDQRVAAILTDLSNKVKLQSGPGKVKMEKRIKNLEDFQNQAELDNRELMKNPGEMTLLFQQELVSAPTAGTRKNFEDYHADMLEQTKRNERDVAVYNEVLKYMEKNPNWKSSQAQTTNSEAETPQSAPEVQVETNEVEKSYEKLISEVFRSGGFAFNTDVPKAFTKDGAYGFNQLKDDRINTDITAAINEFNEKLMGGNVDKRYVDKGIHEGVIFRPVMEPIYGQVEVQDWEKGRFGKNVRVTKQVQGIVGEKPTAHKNVVKDGKEEEAVEMFYTTFADNYSDASTTYQVSDGRGGNYVRASIILPKSVALELENVGKQDPNVIREIIQRTATEKFGIPEAAWSRGQGTPLGNVMAPPHEQWARETGGKSRMYFKEPGTKTGGDPFNPDNIVEF